MVDCWNHATTLENNNNNSLDHSFEADHDPVAKFPKLEAPFKASPMPDAFVRDLMAQRITQGAEDAFYIADMGAVIRQHRLWHHWLPRIQPFYAVKCNNNSQVLRTLLSLGTGFDCASRGEMEAMLALGAQPTRLIYANPCKQASHIRFARDHGIRRMTFDNASELYKVNQHYPDAEMVLRVLTDDSRSICKLGTKFGCRPENTRTLLETAKTLGIAVVGVSFHVGSGCRDRMAFVDAVQRARRVFDEGRALGFHMTLLDVGGGFPGAKPSSSDDSSSSVSFEEIASVLRPAVDRYFPAAEMPDVEIIAEPGRFYVAAAFTLAVSVTSRRVIANGMNEAAAERCLLQKEEQLAEDAVKDPDQFTFMYYVNDGVYGSFNCLLFDHAHVTPQVLIRQGQRYSPEDTSATFACSVWGPTCDSMDCLTKTARLPEMRMGDWLLFDNMGAYTVAAASSFNGFELSRISYINTEQQQQLLLSSSSLSLEGESLTCSSCVSSVLNSDVEGETEVLLGNAVLTVLEVDVGDHHEGSDGGVDAAGDACIAVSVAPVAVC